MASRILSYNRDYIIEIRKNEERFTKKLVGMPGNGIRATQKRSGFAPVNGLQLYYEIEGIGSPLVHLGMGSLREAAICNHDRPLSAGSVEMMGINDYLYIRMFNILILLGAAQGLFLAVLLMSKRSDRTASLLLAALMIVLSTMLAGISLQTNPELKSILPAYPHLYGIIDPLPFLLGPLLYLYARLYLGKKDFLRWKDIVHFAPFLVCILYFLPFYSLNSQEKLIYISGGRPISASPDLIAGLRVIQGLIYIFFCNQLFRINIRNRKPTPGSVEMIQIKWIGLFTKALFFLWMALAILLLSKRLGLKTLPNIDMVISLFISAGLYAIGYIGLRRSNFFTDPVYKKNSAEKYKNSGLTADLSTNYVDRLLAVMKDKKFYKDNDLTLKSLAEKVRISPNHLSQIINGHFHQSFNDFINEYRVKEAQQLILSVPGANLKLLAIAFEVGFNSKSTFNTAFRKIAGMSPSEFRKRSGLSL